MEEIKVGDYIRVNGIIGKVEQIGNSLFWLEDGSSHSLSDKKAKHSKHIIDLIEIGDYVNLERILDISEEYIRTTERIHNKNWLQSNIETILTHEQFEQNLYKV